MNHAIFAGRLGADADLRYTENGHAVANFSLAVTVGWGEREETLWVACALWGERAEKLAPYLTKGKALTAAGDVNLRTFERRNGDTGASITCNVQRITLQSGRDAGDPSRTTRPAQQRAEEPAPEEAPFDDDIPF
jgi:single-strand DNA-binding protein